MKFLQYFVVAVVVTVTALFVFQPFELNDVSVSVNLYSDAKTLTEQLGTPAGAINVSKLTIDGPDGPMPEIAVRSFQTKSTSDSIKQFYNNKCKEVGLLKPDNELLHLEPTAICDGRTKNGNFTVLLFIKCTDIVCSARTEVRHLI